MNLFYWTTLTFLGGGIVAGGFRRKKDKTPRGFWGILAALALAYGSLGLGAWLPGEWAAMLGQWVYEGTRNPADTFAYYAAWTTGIALVVGCGFWTWAAGKDVIADKVPDEAALSFCIAWSLIWQMSLGCAMGEAIHDPFAALPGQWWAD